MNKEVLHNPHPLEYQPVERQEVFGPMHDMLLDDWEREQALARVRHGLSNLEIDREEPAFEGGEHIPVILADAPPKNESPLGVLQEKALKRKAKEVKEREPQRFSEMLVVVNDLQLLRSADDEAIGAFLKWLKANGKKVTHLVANGDILDFEAHSGFPSAEDAEVSKNKLALDEIEAGRWFFNTVAESTPNAQHIFVSGNHEQRYFSKMKDRALDGELPWLKTPEEMFGLEGWKTIPYGMNQKYEWHGRIFWHGNRAGSKSDIAKLELQDTGLLSVTTAHVNRNMYHEERRANGELISGITHGGFSKDSLGFMKKANTGWSQGFGIYFWDKKVGEQPYSVIMKHGNPRFISPEGEIFDGTGFNLRQEIGLDPRERRGRPRKI